MARAGSASIFSSVWPRSEVCASPRVATVRVGSVQRLGGLRGHAAWRASICPGISAQTRLPEEPNNVSAPNVWTLPRPTHPIAQLHGAGPQVREATTDRAASDTGRPPPRCYPAPSRGSRFTRSKQATFSLVQERRKRIETRRDRSGIDHTTRVDAPASVSLPFTDSFVAPLPTSRFFSSDSVVQAQALSGQHSKISMVAASISTTTLRPACTRCQPEIGDLSLNTLTWH